METVDYHQIKAWCREAQEIADDYGVEEALSYLMGEKFAPLLRQAKNARSQVQHLYSEKDREMVQSLAEKDQAFRLGYMMTLENNYKEQLEQIKHLEQLTSDFVQEIREAFEEQDVIEFLENYPRLEVPEDDLSLNLDSLTSADIDQDQMTAKDILAEVDDIFLAEEMRKLLLENRQAR